MRVDAPSSPLTNRNQLHSFLLQHHNSIATFAAACQRSAAHPSDQIGFAMWANIVHASGIAFERHVHVHAAGKNDRAAPCTLRVSLGPQETPVTLALPKDESLSDWLELRCDALAREHEAMPARSLADFSLLLSIEQVMLLWPSPKGGAWRKEHWAQLSHGAFQWHRQAKPVFLKTVLGRIARQCHRQSESLAPTHVDPWRAGMPSTPHMPQPTPPQAMSKPEAPAQQRPSDIKDDQDSDTVEESPTPTAVAGKKKKKKKGKTKSSGETVDVADVAVSLASLREQTVRYAKEQADHPVNEPACVAGLLRALQSCAAQDGPLAAWQTAHLGCKQSDPDIIWSLCRLAQTHQVMVPPTFLTTSVITQGIPTSARGKRDARDVLLFAAGDQKPPMLWPQQAQAGLAALLDDHDTQIAALAFCARTLMATGEGDHLPIYKRIDAAQHKIQQAYTRALKQSAAACAPLLPLLFLAHRKKAAHQLATHLLPLSIHGHLQDKQVIRTVSLMFAGRPELMLEFPYTEPMWLAPLHEALNGWLCVGLQQQALKATTAYHLSLAQAFQQAQRFLHVIKEGGAKEALLTLQACFEKERADADMDLLLVIAGKPIISCLQIIANAANKEEEAAVSLEALIALTTFLQHEFPHRIPLSGLSQAEAARAQSYLVAADQYREQCLDLFAKECFFLPHIERLLNNKIETLSEEDGDCSRYILSPYIRFVFEALGYEGSTPGASVKRLELQRQLAQRMCQSVWLRRAFGFTIMDKWPTPVPGQVRGKLVASCDTRANAKSLQQNIPGDGKHFLIRYAIRMTPAFVFDTIEHNIAFLEAYEAEGRLTSEVEERLWYQTTPVLLAMTRRNAFVPWIFGEPAVLSLTRLFQRVPPQYRRLWAARLTGLCRASERYAFFHPDEPHHTKVPRGSDTSKICPENFLPIVVAMCRALNPDGARALAQAYVQSASRHTDDFRDREVCGAAQAFFQRTCFALGEYIVGQPPKGTHSASAAEVMAISSPQYTLGALGFAHQDGFMTFDRVMFNLRAQLRQQTDELHAQRLTDQSAVSALRVHFGQTLASQPESIREKLAIETVLYLRQYASWRGETEGPGVEEQLVHALLGANLADVPAIEALTTREQAHMERRLVARRIVSDLTMNPRSETLLERLAPLSTAAYDDEDLVMVLQHEAAPLSRLIGEPNTLNDVVEFGDATDKEGAEPSAAHRALAPATLMAANTIRVWNAYMQSDLFEDAFDDSELPLGVPIDD